MSSWTGYVVAILLPVLYKGGPNPVSTLWMIRHGVTQLPADVERKAIWAGNIQPFVSQLVLGLTLFLLLRNAGWTVTSVGLSPVLLYTSLLVGIVAGLSWLAVYALIFRHASSTVDKLQAHPLMQRPLMFWLPLGASSAVVEEVWRGVCLAALKTEGPVVAVFVTTLAFSAAHGRPTGRLISSALFAICCGSAFLLTGSLWLTISAHATVNFGTPLLFRAAIRRKQGGHSGDEM